MSRFIFKMSVLTANGIETQTIRLNNNLTCKVDSRMTIEEKKIIHTTNSNRIKWF